MKHLKTGLTGLWVGSALIGMPSDAHHSFGMFDMSAEAEIVVEGVVREWKFMNPHSWLLITVTEKDGGLRTWSFEAGTVPQLLQRGITKDTYRVGDFVRVRAGPMNGSRPGGMVKVVEHENGDYTIPIQTGGGQEALDRWLAADAR